MSTLDLHGMTYDQAKLEVENFVLLEDMPVKIITGNSVAMLNLVDSILKQHGLCWDYESHFNLGAIVVIDPT